MTLFPTLIVSKKAPRVGKKGLSTLEKNPRIWSSDDLASVRM